MMWKHYSVLKYVHYIWSMVTWHNNIATWLILTLMISCTQKPIDLMKVVWIHGSEDCSRNNDPAIQIVKYNATTYILRQNKCLNFEAPFMFLFIGDGEAMLMDTGATEKADSFPLEQTVSSILLQHKVDKLTVAHTHNHSDHYAADQQFIGRTNTQLVGLSPQEVIDFFDFKDWPHHNKDFYLGERIITLIPIPGHEASFHRPV